MIGTLIGFFVMGLITITIGVMILPEISKVVEEVALNQSGNLTGGTTTAVDTLLDITPLIFALAIAIALLPIVIRMLRGVGLGGGGSFDADDSEDFEEEETEDDEGFVAEETEDDDNFFKTKEKFFKAKSTSKPEHEIPKSKMTEKDFVKSEFD